MKFFFFAFLLITSVNSRLFAQAEFEAQVIPSGVFIANYSLYYSYYDQFVRADANYVDLLDARLRDEGLNEEDVDGKITNTKLTQLTVLQVGLTDWLTFGFKLPYVQAKRTSNLIERNSSEETKAFLEKYGTKEKSGQGDREFWFLSRLSYSDEVDFQVGLFGVISDSNDQFSNENDPEIGKGNDFLKGLLRWYFYSRYSNLRTQLAFTYSSPYGTSDVKNDDGTESTLDRGLEYRAFLEIEDHDGALEYSFYSFWETIETSRVFGESQNDGQVRFVSGVKIGLSNLYLMEKREIRFPWRVQAQFQNAFRGINTPREYLARINLFYYF